MLKPRRVFIQIWWRNHDSRPATKSGDFKNLGLKKCQLTAIPKCLLFDITARKLTQAGVATHLFHEIGTPKLLEVIKCVGESWLNSWLASAVQRWSCSSSRINLLVDSFFSLKMSGISNFLDNQKADFELKEGNFPLCRNLAILNWDGRKRSREKKFFLSVFSALIST